MNIAQYFLFFLLFLVSNSVCFSQCDHPDFEGLMELYNQTQGSVWRNNAGWKDGEAGSSCNPCSWHGITCENDRVVKLRLSHENLKGALPDLKLTELKELDLQSNEINGGVPNFTFLTKLEVLNLSDNYIVGPILDLDSLKNLVKLDVGHNMLTAIFIQFSEFTMLEELDLNDNILQTTMPDISNMPNLKIADFGVNKLIGEVIDYQGLPNLEQLVLYHNEFSGNIPDFSGMPKLVALNLFMNNFSGNIPDFSNLPQLEAFVFYENQFTGELPALLKAPNLRILDGHRNDLTGSIPSYSHLTELKEIRFDSNRLSGSLPQLPNSPNVTLVKFARNNLTGEIPDYSHFENLRLDLAFNMLTGPIPDLSEVNISILLLNSNNLSGCLSDFICEVQHKNLTGNKDLPWNGNIEKFCNGESQFGAPCGGQAILNLATIQDDCSCEIVPCVSSHPAYGQLMEFYYSSNGPNWVENRGWDLAALGGICDPCYNQEFAGKWFGINCDTLGNVVGIDLDGVNDGTANGFEGNGITGTAPQFDLPHLKTLILNGNDLSGNAPDLSLLPNLERLGLSFNNFSGPLPSFSSNPKLRFIRVSFNQFTGPIPDLSSLTDLNTFTAANNKLSGCFPEDICALSLFHATENIALPWMGDHSEFCDGNTQIGAPCQLESTGMQGVITNDCECEALTSLNDLDVQEFSFYPNPARDVLTINPKEYDLTYDILNMNGGVVQSGNVIQSEVNVGLLAPAIYMLQLKTKKAYAPPLRFVKL